VPNVQHQFKKSIRSNLIVAPSYFAALRCNFSTASILPDLLCMSNNAAERELRAIAVGRRNWTFAGSDEGGRRAAAIYTLIATATLNDVDPQAWLADVLARLPDHPAKPIHELLPWNWRPQDRTAEAA
jgi:transposase